VDEIKLGAENMYYSKVSKYSSVKLDLLKILAKLQQLAVLN